ncbi:hypothetical protein [Ferrimonas gelatinilytica]|uniref:BIG2 domain-containing protein n=1 Tax=Ferrimonas gelatinilytica TaxID=1255257 RepID=A0ABP9RTA3_9GAMM
MASQFVLFRYILLMVSASILIGCGGGSNDSSGEEPPPKEHGHPLFFAQNVTKTYGDADFSQKVSGGNDGFISYSSSDNSVATVGASSGQVTIIGAGRTTITASEAESSRYFSQSTSYLLTVKKAPGKPITIGDDMLLTYGDEDFVQAAEGGNGEAIRYTSSDPTVASVNTESGVVSIKGAGAAVITATQAESENYLSQSASYQVVVAKASGAAGTPLFFAGDVNKFEDDPPFSYSAQGGNGGHVSYSSNNEQVASVDSNGLVTIKGSGEAQIIAQEAESNNYFGQSTSYILTVEPVIIVIPETLWDEADWDDTNATWGQIHPDAPHWNTAVFQ